MYVQNRYVNAGTMSWPITFCFIIIWLSLAGCGIQTRNTDEALSASIEKGKNLASQHCRSCHELPDPALLDNKTWNTGSLPAMGPLLGIFNYKGQAYTFLGDRQMQGPGYLSENPAVTQDEWQSIVDYYTATSPAQLPAQDRSDKIELELPGFEIIQPDLRYTNARTCFLKVRENQKASIVVSDATTFKTYFMNNEFTPIDSITSYGPLVNIDFTGDREALACNVGILIPNNEALGSAAWIRESSGHWKADSNLFSSLRRPLQVSPVDLNNDDKKDYLVGEFGYLTGSLSWMEAQGNEHYQRHVLRALPGVLKAYPLDYNQDGMMDIVALFSQGYEGIFLYLNKGNGIFEELELLRFPAVYGSSSFELDDFNNDGLLDLLYTCGDNADFSSVLKPYHGVYIFINKGREGFQQSFFYPIHGCYKALAKDFDKDGDLDLATIAFYADFADQPEEGFVYLKNRGDFQFSPYSSVKLQSGRWITMDAGDIDGDGWCDIVLGNFAQSSTLVNPAVNWATAPPVMILKNKGH